jgi:N-acylneuraminate cytidylyltransferase
VSLGGIPLIAHSILEAQNNNAIIDAVYVTTDDAEIKKIAQEYGAIVIDRPAHLSGDLEPTVTALKHVIETITDTVENVFLLQPTNPLRPSNLIAEGYQMFQEQQVDSLMTVTRNHQKFGKIMEHVFVPFNYTIGQRSQDLEPLFFENGLLYITKSELILQEKIIGTKNFPMIVDHPFANVDIDTQDDFDYAVYLWQKSQLPNAKL